MIGQKLLEWLRAKQFYIENHSGAGGNLGTGIAAHAPGDGYTIMITSQALVINTSLYKSLPYDPFKDFIAVTRIATTPNVLVVNPDVPTKTVKELVALIRKQPDKYTSYAQPGIGTAGAPVRQNCSSCWSSISTLTSIPFGGGGPMVQSVVAGHTPIAFSSLRAGGSADPGRQADALAVTAEKRDGSLPERADHGRGWLSRADRRDADRHSWCRPAPRKEIRCAAARQDGADREGCPTSGTNSERSASRRSATRRRNSTLISRRKATSGAR